MDTNSRNTLQPRRKDTQGDQGEKWEDMGKRETPPRKSAGAPQVCEGQAKSQRGEESFQFRPETILFHAIGSVIFNEF